MGVGTEILKGLSEIKLNHLRIKFYVQGRLLIYLQKKRNQFTQTKNKLIFK